MGGISLGFPGNFIFEKPDERTEGLGGEVSEKRGRSIRGEKDEEGQTHPGRRASNSKAPAGHESEDLEFGGQTLGEGRVDVFGVVSPEREVEESSKVAGFLRPVERENSEFRKFEALGHVLDEESRADEGPIADEGILRVGLGPGGPLRAESPNSNPLHPLVGRSLLNDLQSNLVEPEREAVGVFEPRKVDRGLVASLEQHLLFGLCKSPDQKLLGEE